MTLRDAFARYAIGVGFLGLVLAVIVIPSFAGMNDIAHPGGDFLNMWGGPQMPLTALSDAPLYVAHLGRLVGHSVDDYVWSYPLTMLFFAWPLTLLPYWVAYGAWNLLGLGFTLWVFARAMGRAQDRRALLLVALSPFVIVNIFHGQNGMFTAALSLLALVWLAPRPVLAGIMIGLLSLKPQLGLLWPLVLIATGAWRSFAAASVTTLSLLGLSFAVHGPEAWERYFTVMGPLHWEIAAGAPAAEGYFTYHLMMPGILPSLRMLGVEMTTALMAQLAGALVALVLVWRIFRATDVLAWRALGLGTASLLLSPYGFNYDMGLITMALVLCWRQDVPTRIAHRYLHGLLFLAPIAIFKLHSLGLPLVPLLLLAGLLYAYRQTRKSS